MLVWDSLGGDSVVLIVVLCSDKILFLSGLCETEVIVRRMNRVSHEVTVDLDMLLWMMS